MTWPPPGIDWYYHDDYTCIACADCRALLPLLPKVECMITDPVWPNNTLEEFADIRPKDLLQECLEMFTGDRIAIHLGLDSDPRMLVAVPEQLAFFRSVQLRYARPHYKGRLLYDRDVAYLYGTPPPSRKGYHIITGDLIDSDSGGKQADHPCPRKLLHVSWLIDRWSAPCETIIDPFAGSCTTARAAKDLRRKCICIEREEKWCAVGVKRLRQEVLAL